MEKQKNKTKSLIIILISTFALVSNLGGLIAAFVVFGDMSIPVIFPIVCGIMVIASIIGLIYGIRIGRKG